MRGKNIVIVGQQPWDTELGSNCKDIALEFSKQNTVLYVNSPLDRISSLRYKNNPNIKRRKEVIAGKQNGLVQIGENIWNLYPDCLVESINWLDNTYLFSKINRINNRRFAKSIKKALAILNFDDYILFNDNEIIKCFYLKEYLSPRISMYYSRDFIVASPYWKKHGNWLEPLIIAKNDLCFANSIYLMNYCKQYNSNSYYVGQGFDRRLFNNDKKSLIEDLQGLTRPIVGYIGVLHSTRLSIDILEHIARSKPDWTLVLVGPEDKEFEKSRLHEMSNVIFVGMKPMEVLPAYINMFDVCINPQFLTPLTVGNYPRKVDEYLAMGKPVVASITHAMEMFSEYTYLTNTKEEYIELISLAISEDNDELREKRKQFTAQHTWENSVNCIYEEIQRFITR